MAYGTTLVPVFQLICCLKSLTVLAPFVARERERLSRLPAARNGLTHTPFAMWVRGPERVIQPGLQLIYRVREHAEKIQEGAPPKNRRQYRYRIGQILQGTVTVEMSLLSSEQEPADGVRPAHMNWLSGEAEVLARSADMGRALIPVALSDLRFLGGQLRGMQSAKEMTCDAVLGLLIARSLAVEWCAILEMVGGNDSALKDVVECMRVHVEGVSLPQIGEKFFFSCVRRLKSIHCQVHEYGLAVGGLAELADPAAVDKTSLTIGRIRRCGDWQVGDYPERRTPWRDTIAQLRGLAHAAGLINDLSSPLEASASAVHAWLVVEMRLSADGADEVTADGAIMLLRARAASRGREGSDRSDSNLWITNGQAAELLVGSEKMISNDRAKSRVSAAGKAGAFRTNGQRGRTKRIHCPSFISWMFNEQKRLRQIANAPY